MKLFRITIETVTEYPGRIFVDRDAYAVAAENSEEAERKVLAYIKEILYASGSIAVKDSLEIPDGIMRVT